MDGGGVQGLDGAVPFLPSPAHVRRRHARAASQLTCEFSSPFGLFLLRNYGAGGRDVKDDFSLP